MEARSSIPVIIPQSEFKVVCADCGSLSIKVLDPANAPASTVIECGRCNAPRGTLAALHHLARQGGSDLFELAAKPFTQMRALRETTL